MILVLSKKKVDVVCLGIKKAKLFNSGDRYSAHDQDLVVSKSDCSGGRSDVGLDHVSGATGGDRDDIRSWVRADLFEDPGSHL
jgi:hypothetical protein